jgi:5'-nucleotidase
MNRDVSMHILVTNDDGVTASGLLALAQAMKKLGEVSVVAPDHNWSASGHTKTMHRPLRVTQTTLADGTLALATDGAPSDCVALALLGLLPEPVDLVVSGINPYANLGHDITYSGTVTSAMEAAIGGIPGIAVSLDSRESLEAGRDYGPAARYAAIVARRVLTVDMPKDTVLNVNVPNLPMSEIKGIRITRQGLRFYQDKLVVRDDPRGQPYYWIGGDPPTSVPENGTDSGALEAGYVSLTPLRLDFTDYDSLDRFSKLEWETG